MLQVFDTNYISLGPIATKHAHVIQEPTGFFQQMTCFANVCRCLYFLLETREELKVTWHPKHYASNVLARFMCYWRIR